MICTKCKQDKVIDCFSMKNTLLNLRNKICKECHKEYSRNHYLLNKQYYYEKAKEREKKIIKDNKEFIIGYLKKHPCIDCGNSDIRVLRFDHRDPLQKEHNISQIYFMKQEILIKEISKCEIRCANCHIIRHIEEKQSFRSQAVVV